MATIHRALLGFGRCPSVRELDTLGPDVPGSWARKSLWASGISNRAQLMSEPSRDGGMGVIDCHHNRLSWSFGRVSTV